MKNRFILLVFAVASLAVACGHKTAQKTTEEMADKTILEDSDVFGEETEENEAEDSDRIVRVTTLEALLALDAKNYYGSIQEDMELSEREMHAMAMANRVVTMYSSVDYSDADMVWMWADAVEHVLNQYAKDNRMKYDSAVYDLHNALSYYGYDVMWQSSMNVMSYYLTVIYTFDVVSRYRHLIGKLTDEKLKKLIRAEYKAWFGFSDAQYFTNVYHAHAGDSYSALPLDLGDYHKYLMYNRIAVLNVVEEVLVNNKVYRQRGKTVTGKQWRKWLDEQGYDKGMSPEFKMNEPEKTDFPALIKDKAERWLSARQAVAAYMGTQNGKGRSYDNLTADIHACIIGSLKPLVRMYGMEGVEGM